MADDMNARNAQSLAGLASVRGAVGREAPASRYRTAKADTKDASDRSAKKTKFDGFLNAFMGKDKNGMSPASGKTGSVTRKASAKAVDGKKAEKNGMERPERFIDVNPDGSPEITPKTSEIEHRDPDRAPTKASPPENETPALGEEYPAEVAAAAEEAARLIWNLLHGPAEDLPPNLAELPEDDGDAVRLVAELLNGGGDNGLAGVGFAGTVNREALRQAMETANASAEMNSAAVLSSLEELLDGMPRQALAEALSRLEEAMGVPAANEGDAFNRIAAALGAEVTAVGGNEADLLAFLGASAARPETEAPTPETAQNILPEAAEISGEIAGLADAENETLVFSKNFSEFTEENSAADPISENDSAPPVLSEAVSKGIAESLPGDGNINAGKPIAFSRTNAEPEAVILPVAAGNIAVENTEENPPTGANLEMPLLGNNAEEATPPVKSVKPAEADNGSALPSQVRAASANEASVPTGAEVQPPAPQVPAAARHGNANPVAMSTMLDQIENIERLAEAMRMANKNGMKHLTMELSPPELGKVMLRVEARDGVVSAYLRVEKPEAAAQLGSSLDQLRQALRQQGVELAELSLQQRGANESLGDFSGQRQGGGREAGESRSDRRRGRRSEWGGGGDETEAVSAASGAAGPGALNLFA